MDNKSYNSKYDIWCYSNNAHAVIILQNFFSSDYFNFVDMFYDKSKFMDIENLELLDKPDLLICDDDIELEAKIKNILANAQCGQAKVTTHSLQTYTGNAFELTNEQIQITQLKGDSFIVKTTTKLENSLNKLVDMCQMANFAKIHKIVEQISENIKSNMNINERISNTSIKTLQKEYLFKLANALNNFIDHKDHYTAGHSQRVSLYSEALGHALNLSNDEIEDLILAANLHDIGKIGLPDAVITKTSKLNDFEFGLMKKHVELGADILPSNAYGNIKDAIRGHHERLDGSGYPDGLKGDEVPLFAQIIAIADSFDAMTSQRSYNQIKSIQDAFDDLRAHTKPDENGKGYFYNAELVETFINLIQNSKTTMDDLAYQKQIADANYLRYQAMNQDSEITNIIVEDSNSKGGKSHA